MCDQQYPHHSTGVFFYLALLVGDDVVDLPAVALTTTYVLIKEYVLSTGILADITALGIVIMFCSLLPKGRGLACLGY